MLVSTKADQAHLHPRRPCAGTGWRATRPARCGDPHAAQERRLETDAREERVHSPRPQARSQARPARRPDPDSAQAGAKGQGQKGEGDGRESARWGKTVERVMSRLGESSQVVHVMDREADSFLLFEDMLRAGRAFVVRICHDRRIVDDEHEFLLEAIEHVDMTLEREVSLSRRSDRHRRIEAKQTHLARETRTAHLAVGARAVTILCGRRNRRFVERPELTLNIVRVWEPNPPADQPAVEWLLITNLPTSSPAQLEVVVDIYRARWTIEEFFKALKTGCSFEQRQLESRHALENALAILAPIACRMLLLRTLAQTRPQAPATDVLTPIQLDVLRVLSARFKLPRNPSVGDALLAVAGLGGFLKRNGQPGWQTIGLGFEQLLQAELIWKAAKSGQRSDLS